MDWDDELDTELKRMNCSDFKEGFAGRCMEALNHSIQSGEQYKPIGIEFFIGAAFRKVTFSAAGLLLVLLVLTFGVNYDTPGVTNGILTETTEDGVSDDWLESVGDQLAAGIL